MVQWFPALEDHFALVHGLLAPSGLYLVSGFLRGNFPELNTLLAEVPFGHKDFPGHWEPDIAAAARKAGFGVEALETDEDREEYPDARAFLDYIRGLGSARRPEEGHPMTRGRLGLLMDRYQERYGADKGGGVRATWRTWYALLAKKED